MSFPREGNLQRAIAFFAALGIGVAGYIAIAEAGGDSPVCLAGGSGCQTVADSSYSEVAGVNIAIFGVVGYVLLLASAFFANDAARFGGFALALGGSATASSSPTSRSSRSKRSASGASPARS